MKYHIIAILGDFPVKFILVFQELNGLGEDGLDPTHCGPV